MTLFSTIAWDKATPSALGKSGVIIFIAVALAVGVGLGFLVSNADATPVAHEASEVSGLAHEEFLRMNTEDFDHLSLMRTLPPMASGVSAADPFTVRNVDSYQSLEKAVTSRHAADSYFYEINTSTIGSAVPGSLAPVEANAAIINNSEPVGLDSSTAESPVPWHATRNRRRAKTGRPHHWFIPRRASRARR